MCKLPIDIYPEIYIYRKPTTTDTTIHFTSTHPNEHKLAGVSYENLMERGHLEHPDKMGR